MPIRYENGEFVEGLVVTKMCEEFSHKISNDNAGLYSNCDGFEAAAGYDHMYASHNENNPSSNDSDCQTTAQSEVRFLKDWLVFHLDLIQQQNEDILDKEQRILQLKEENEMLKERLSCMEKGLPFEPKQEVLSTKATSAGDMTQDSVFEDNKTNVRIEKQDFDEHTSLNESSEVSSEQEFNSTLNSSGLEENHIKVEDFPDKPTIKTENQDDLFYEFSPESDFNAEFDPMRNLRMNIRRKRLCSTSSALSNNDSALEDKQRSHRKFKKKKCLGKDAQVLTTVQEYLTQAGNVTLGIPVDLRTATTTLEVPRWRVKVYPSCYTMEGTENLDDEVYNKRHMRHENDERRRKRWDVQRIREQRVIEKLKQRQERIGSGSRNDEQIESLESLWPKLDDIKYLEVSEELPVSAFGSPIPKLSPSEFDLPWLALPPQQPPPINNKKNNHHNTKRSSGKRKSKR